MPSLPFVMFCFGLIMGPCVAGCCAVGVSLVTDKPLGFNVM